MLNYWIFTLDQQNRILGMQPICADKDIQQLIEFAETLDKTGNFKQVRIERKTDKPGENKIVWMSKIQV